ncbi:MAG: hypothetical protein ACJ8FY_14515 [Gemmataceae bacterium]
MAAGFANALMFISLMLAGVVVGFIVISYAAHCFLLIIEDTAAGNDEVIWPEEPLYDWIMKGFYLVAVVAIWLAPLGVIARILKVNGASQPLFLSWLGLAIALLWLMFPISLFSAMSAQSRWVLLRWTILRELARVSGALLTLYFASGLLLAALVGLGYLTVEGGRLWLLVFLGPMASWGLLVYGRLLGRLAWQLEQLKPRKKKKSASKPNLPKGYAADSTDPWKGPPKRRKRKKIPEPEPAPRQKAKPALEGYAISSEPLPAHPTDIPLDGYAAVGYETVPVRHDPEEERELAKRNAEGREIPQPSALQMQLAQRTKLPPPPNKPMFSGVYNFPFYPTTLQAFVKLGLGFYAMGAIMMAARNFLPW